MEEEAPSAAELTTFKALAFVYFPLPAVSRNRAELWGVANPLNARCCIKCTTVSCGDDLYVRLLTDDDSEELFAECPLPNDGSPLSRSVEGCIDSSRYFILRIVDRTDAKKHTMIGVGFRERSEATEFSAALDDYRGYLRRKFEAQEMRKKYEQEQAEGLSSSQETGGHPHPLKKNSLALPPGQKIHVRIGSHSKDSSQEKRSSSSAQPVDLAAAVAAMKLQLPPPTVSKSSQDADFKPSDESPTAHSGEAGASTAQTDGESEAGTVHCINASGAAGCAAGLQPAGQQNDTAGGKHASSQDVGSTIPGADNADDDWTDFQG